MLQSLDGRKRLATLILALGAIAARRFNLSPDELALLLDIVEVVLGLGLGAHVASAVAKARAAAKVAKVAAVLLVVAGCNVTALRDCEIDVSKSDPSKDRIRCADHEPIKAPRMDPVLRKCVLEAKP